METRGRRINAKKHRAAKTLRGLGRATNVGDPPKK